MKDKNFWKNIILSLCRNNGGFGAEHFVASPLALTLTVLGLFNIGYTARFTRPNPFGTSYTSKTFVEVRRQNMRREIKWNQ